MGTIDRTIRVLAAIIVGLLYLTHTISGTLALVLEIIAIAFVATSLIGWCPVYLPFGLSTRKSNGGPPAIHSPTPATPWARGRARLTP
ncbi:MAG: YgaP family membrane protein [Gemmatimonadales bacterium]